MSTSYAPKSYAALLGLTGFSETLLTNHFTLYEGYVNNTNRLSERLAKLREEGETGTPEYAELKRRFGWEWNGMRLHECYFENLTKTPLSLNKESTLSQGIVASFGSFEMWEKDFRGTGAMRGIGWVLLVKDPETDHLFNVWINEHDLGHLAGTVPIIVMDVFEHAYMLDYGLKRAEYIDAFFRSLDWNAAEKRFSGQAH